jgi:23S rRNA pseudouridine1911/1915/1917 synthase
VCGDDKYGSTQNPIHRLCLHAYRLYLYHPVTGQRMEFETPYPTDFTNLFNKH